MTLDANEIEQIIPHRYPFLLVDRIVEIEDGKRAVGLKSVTANEWFFEGHFPGRKIMPGVLIIEALAQTAAVAMMRGNDAAGRVPLFAGMDGVRFRRPVVPGDQLRLEFELEKLRRTVGRGRVSASVDGEVVAEATITFALADPAEG